MTNLIEVSVLDMPMGILAWDQESEEILFEFLPEFLENDFEISPVAYSKESLRKNPHVFHSRVIKGKIENLPGFFKDCMPGEFSSKLLLFALQGTGKTPNSLSPLSVFSLLGNRGTGAYGFEPHGYPELDHAESADIDRIQKTAHQLYKSGKNELGDKGFKELMRCGLFTTGQVPEAFLAINDFTGEVLSGQSSFPEGFEAWTLRIGNVLNTGAGSAVEEYDYFRKAVDCGIEMAPCRILMEGAHKHLLVKRIDRIESQRLHIQSFNALKNKEDEYSYESVFRCMRNLKLTYADFVQMYERMIFNVLINNTSYSGNEIMFVSTTDNVWKLAPATRLSPTPWVNRYALSACGKNSDLTMDDLLKFGKYQSIRRCKQIIDGIKEKSGIID